MSSTRLPTTDIAQDPALGEPESVHAYEPGTNVRNHLARGAVINSAFQIGLYGVGTAERLVVATWLTRTQYGLWGILLAALIALGWLKQAGIGDKYIQQSEPDQELAFQRAFTLELILSLGFFALAAAALPLYALAYGQPEIVLPGLVLALVVPITAFQAPAWIPYRQMRYRRQRVLSSVDPITTIALSITLTVVGLGYWGLVIGAVGGSVIGAVVCVATSSYPLRLHIDWSTVKSYTSFSWPLVGFGLCTFVIIQGTTFVANSAVGLAGIGTIGLAVNLSGMSDGVDAIVGQTIYPAVCASAHRTELLAETFVKSNRIALMWAVPAMVGVALFAGDLVHFVLGDRWHAAVPVFVIVALTCGLAQVGFNWSIFLRAVNHTRPILIAALADVLVFLLVSVPAILIFGLVGYAVGLAAITVVQVGLRAWYMRQLFGDFSALRQLTRAVLPSLPPASLVLLVRVIDGGSPSALRAIAELILFCTIAVVSTLLIERALVRELLDYLRGVRDRSVTGVRSADASPPAVA